MSVADKDDKEARYIAALVGNLARLCATISGPGVHDGLVALLLTPQHGDHARAILADAHRNLGKVLAEVDAATERAQPDECAANQNGHHFGAHGRRGERQCEWCGQPEDHHG